MDAGSVLAVAARVAGVGATGEFESGFYHGNPVGLRNEGTKPI
jgi:hypothetical protein